MLDSGGDGGIKMGEMEFPQYEPLTERPFDTHDEAVSYIKTAMYEAYGVKTQIIPDKNGKFIVWYTA